MADLTRYVDRFPSAKIVVVGDLMLDHYVWGQVTRISPEAPVQVVEVQGEEYRLGGAANVAHNVAALGGHSALCGVMGNDEAGQRLRALLKDQQIGVDGLLADSGRPTTIKSRIVAHHQQVVRVDREVRHPLQPSLQKQLFAKVEPSLPGSQCLVLSDYAKGVLTEGFIQDLIQLARRYQVNVVADPKVANFDAMKGASVVTPNHLEAMQIASGRVASTDDVIEVGRHLLARLDGAAVLITRGDRGMTLFQQDQKEEDIAAAARQVFDVTGAGDTVTAVLALGLAAGASMIEAARLANGAAGVVVGKVGTATLSREELCRVLRAMTEAGS